ncbi:lanthionine synthetase C family protein [Taibaiella koreensis]|uniref:lanthionine synthetase C family protein n=1 Tax=Taibaiella koreensis TaxID=1268548 RepID=UPI000E5A0992|nr:lanthionine synthetase C family protein [Taibaiella koreensis]
MRSHPAPINPATTKAWTDDPALLLRQHADDILQQRDRIHERSSEFYFQETMEMCLTFAHLYRYYHHEPYLAYVQDLLLRCLESLQEDHLGAGLCGGVSGFLWLYHHLRRMELIDASFPSVKDIEDLVIASLQQDFEAGDYDLLGGFAGKAVALLEAPVNRKRHKALTAVVTQLEQMEITDAEGGLYWLDLDFDNGSKAVINLGLAHGMPSLIILLCKIHAAGIAIRKSKKLIMQSVQWLLRQEVYSETASFPPFLGYGGPARLAWCYGDLGIAFALLHAAAAMDMPRWRDEAIRIALKSTQRRLDDAGVARHPSAPLHDISFCHGTSGLAHMYHRLFQATSVKAFDQAANYWYDLTFSIEKSDRFLAGYPFFFYNETGEEVMFMENFTLLNGLPGILLALHSRITNTKLHWDTCLLTDLSMPVS